MDGASVRQILISAGFVILLTVVGWINALPSHAGGSVPGEARYALQNDSIAFRGKVVGAQVREGKSVNGTIDRFTWYRIVVKCLILGSLPDTIEAYSPSAMWGEAGHERFSYSGGSQWIFEGDEIIAVLWRIPLKYGEAIKDERVGALKIDWAAFVQNDGDISPSSPQRSKHSVPEYSQQLEVKHAKELTSTLIREFSVAFGDSLATARRGEAGSRACE